MSVAIVIGFAILGLAPTVRADEGRVILRSGDVVRGDVIVLAPEDRVVLRLADGATRTVPWPEVSFVLDGNRLVDREGNSTTIETALAESLARPAPSLEPRAVAATDTAGAPREGMVDPRQFYFLPPQRISLAGARVMVGFGTFFLISGFALSLTGGIMMRNAGAFALVVFMPPGIVSGSAGIAMVGRGSSQLGRMRRERPEMFVGIAADSASFVPTLTLRF